MPSLTRVIGGEITLRRAESIADYRACQDAQRLAWGIAEDGYLIPIATMVGANRHGGLVLGAFLADGRAVALSFAFMGRVEGRPCLYSQLTGVVPGRQSLGLGYEIKQLQREYAIAEGVPTIAWAFDPLQARNAHFNLVKLGARSRRYVVDMYGERTDQLNSGLPTDRLIAEWDVIKPPRPSAWGAGAGVLATTPGLIETRVDASGRVEPVRVRPPSGAARVCLATPADAVALRGGGRALTRRWGEAVREAFVAAFDAGYEAVGFVREDDSEGARCGYLLERRDEGV
jgi:predicted GNAT superfamily acetyltransferase